MRVTTKIHQDKYMFLFHDIGAPVLFLLLLATKDLLPEPKNKKKNKKTRNNNKKPETETAEKVQEFARNNKKNKNFFEVTPRIVRAILLLLVRKIVCFTFFANLSEVAHREFVSLFPNVPFSLFPPFSKMHLQEPDDYRKLEVANAPRNYKAYTIAISVISLIVIGVLVAAVAILAQAEEAPSALRTVPETVPLKSKDIVVKAVQSNTVCTLDIPSNFSSLSQSEQDAVEAQLQACIDENVDHVITLFDQACSEGPKPDIVVFHEFPFTGYFSSDRAGKLAASIEIPGPQSDKMKEKTVRVSGLLLFLSFLHFFFSSSSFSSSFSSPSSSSFSSPSSFLPFLTPSFPLPSDVLWLLHCIWILCKRPC